MRLLSMWWARNINAGTPGTPPLPNSWALVVLAVTSFAASGRQRADKGIWTSALRLGGDAFGSGLTPSAAAGRCKVELGISLASSDCSYENGLHLEKLSCAYS